MTQLLQNAVSGTALILAAALLRRGLKGRLIPGARLALWAVCLFRLLTPAAPESALSLWGLLPRAETAPVTAPVIDPLPLPSMGVGTLPAATAPVTGTPAPAPAPVEPVGAAFPWETVLLAVWIGVGALLAVRCALSWNRTRRAVAQAIPLPRDDARYAALPKCARLREGVMDGAPLTFGAVRPTVVLSPGLSGEALDCVLAHEGVHARRRDNLWHYAMGLALVLYWWNPAVWLMARLLRRDIELACDRAAVRKLGPEKRARYAQTLVSMATVAEGPAFCQTFGRKAAEERIISVMKYQKTTVVGAALTLTLVLALTVGFASSPKAVPEGDRTTPASGLFDKPVLGEAATQDQDGKVTEYTVNLEILKQNLDRHVAEGTMAQAEADRIWAMAQDFAQGGKALTWSFQGDSGLTLDELHNVCYRDENGKLIPVDPAAVVSGFIFPASQPEPSSVVQPTESGLVPAIGTKGEEGYIRRSDVPGTPGVDVKNPEEALAFMEWLKTQPGEILIPLYDAGGNVIGSFAVSNSASEAPRPLTLEEYKALLEGLVSGGKVSQEDADWLLANAKEDMEGQECPYLWVVDGGSYAVMGGKFCTLADCGNNSRHTHDGVWYTGWTGKTAVPPYCTDEDCNLSGLHYHQQDGEVVHCYDTLPAEIPVCPVEGCTIWGTHTHDGVTYRCNGGHCGGVCDGSCHSVGDGGGAAPTEEKIPEFVPNYDPRTQDSIGTDGESAIQPVSSGHHGDSHHGNGYQGGHH